MVGCAMVSGCHGGWCHGELCSGEWDPLRVGDMVDGVVRGMFPRRPPEIERDRVGGMESGATMSWLLW